MRTSTLKPSRVAFGLFVTDLSSRELYQDGRRVHLQEKPFRILAMLVERPGEIITREELRRELWPEGTFVEFNEGLDTALSKLRYALGDSAQSPTFIQTIPRRGYRFIAPVAQGVSTATFPDAPIPSPSNLLITSVGERRRRKYGLALVTGALVLIVTVGIFRWNKRSREAAMLNVQITKLTDSGQVSGVAIAPDGRYVVYASRDGENEGLRLLHLATRTDVEILRPESKGFHGLTVSPDGNYIYFVRSDESDPFFKYLFMIPMLGGSPRKLISDVDSPVSFSPDGRRFVYERCIPSHNVIELRVAETNEAGERLLSTISDANCSLFQPGPNWSPDAQTIILPVRMLGRQQRWVLDVVSVSSGEVREFYTTPYDIGRVVWLAGGSSLLMPQYDPASSREQLWTISASGGVTRHFTNDLTEYGTDLDITRDGRTAVGIMSSTISNVWVASLSHPGEAHQITSGSLSMSDIGYTAAGKVLSASTDNKLWIMNSDGSERTLLAEDASWPTPCGSYVVLASFKGGIDTLMRVNADGSNATKLVNGDLWKPSKTSLSSRAPGCSPDGKFVFYVNGGHPQKICRVPVDGGPPVEIVETLGDLTAGRLSISPDGTLLSYLYDQYSSTTRPGWKLVVIPVDGGPAVKTFDAPGGISGPRWSPDGKSLQYLLTQNGVTNLWEQPFAGGKPKQTTQFTSGLIFDFGWSPDQTKLLLSRGTISSDVFLIRNQ